VPRAASSGKAGGDRVAWPKAIISRARVAGETVEVGGGQMAKPLKAPYFPALRLRMARVRRRSAFSLMKPAASFWS